MVRRSQTSARSARAKAPDELHSPFWASGVAAMEYLQSFWESFEAFRDTIVTERVARGLYSVPFSVWIVVAAGLGALTLWTYWRCFVDVRRREMELEAREAALRAMSPDPDSDEDAAEPAGEAHTLRFRNWALETRLRSALEAARSGEPLGAEELADGLEEILSSDATAGEDGAPAEAISALKYRNWRLEMRVAQLEDQNAAGGARDDEEAALEFNDASAETIAALRDRSERQQGWLGRLIAAGKLGDAGAVAAIEDEIASDHTTGASPVEPLAAGLMSRIERLEEDKAALEDQASSLRYRRWLLSRRLGDAVEAARSGAPLSVDALVADLGKDGEEPRFGEPGANAFLSPSTVDAPAPADAAELAELRKRLTAQEIEFDRLRARAADASGRAEAASLRYRLWLSQAELRRLRSADAAPSVDAARLRDALTQSEAARRAAENAGAARVARDAGAGMAARARTASLASKAWVLQRRLHERETELAGPLSDQRAEFEALQARLTRAEARAADADKRVEIAKLRDQEAETLKARLALAQAEAERLKGELERVNLLPKSRDAGPALAAMRAAQSVSASGAGERFALPIQPASSPRLSQGGAQLTRSSQVEKTPSEPSFATPSLAWEESELDESHLAARAALAEAVASPRRGVEDAARELIESGQVVALGSNRPKNLGDAPAEEATDDLTLIAGVTPRLAAQMNSLGLHFFRQIAECEPADLAWLDDMLVLRGGVVRDRWLPQAEVLAGLRRDGRLTLNDDGRYGRLSPKAAAGSGAAALGTAAREERLETLPAHAEAVTIDSPLTGAEVAALELLSASVDDDDNGDAPASFSRQPFAEDDDLDDLKALRGVGPKLEAALRTLGVGRFRQLAVLSPAEAVWLDRRLGLGGRVVRDRWLPQAEALAARSEARRRAATRAPAAPQSAAASAPLRPLVTPASVSGPAQPAEAPRPSLAGGVDNDGLSPIEREALRLIEAGLAGRQSQPDGLLPEPRPGAAPDDLRRINGINGILESLLNDLGLYYFSQLASFSAEDLAWLDAKLSFRGRVAQERWASQASTFARS